MMPLSAGKDPRKSERDGAVLRQRLRRQIGRAIEDFRMIEDGDRVMACMSGGKDSHVMLDMLLHLRERAPAHFDIVAVTLDQGHPGFDAAGLRRYFEKRGVEHRIVFRDTYTVVKRVIPEGKTMCGLCSRLRRGILYSIATEEGATKIALGHHADDILETFFMNMFHGGSLKSMPPRLSGDEGRHVVVRPLSYCRERDIAAYASGREFPIIPCNLCGAQRGARVQMKEMVAAWEKAHPGRVQNIFRALANVKPSHLLDRSLFDFGGAPVPPPTLHEGERIHVH